MGARRYRRGGKFCIGRGDMYSQWQPILRESLPVFCDVGGQGFEQVCRLAGGLLDSFPMLCWVVFVGMAVGIVLLFPLWVPFQDQGDILRPSPVEISQSQVTFTFIKSSIISESLTLFGFSEYLPSCDMMFFSHMNVQVWEIQDRVMHFSIIRRLFSNILPLYPTSSLCASMTSLICLPVMSSDFPKSIRAKICLCPWQT